MGITSITLTWVRLKQAHGDSVELQFHQLCQCTRYSFPHCPFLAFNAIANLTRFYQNHHDKQGIAVLGFHVDNVDAVHARYKQLHPQLIHHHGIYGTTTVLEVYAYYEHISDNSREETNRNEKHPDVGTLIRFVETADGFGSPTFCILPGLTQLHAKFDDRSLPAYFDHWVRCSYRLGIDCRHCPSCNNIVFISLGL
jgi:hypothetical protein